MSLQSWSHEFYRIPAVDPRARTTALVAVRHSLKKWNGLLPENLARHNLQVTGRRLRSVGRPKRGAKFLAIDYSTCALCVAYFNHAEAEVCGTDEGCRKCPLAQVMSARTCQNGARSPYHRFVRKGDPVPMIRALQRAEARLMRQEARAALKKVKAP